MNRLQASVRHAPASRAAGRAWVAMLLLALCFFAAAPTGLAAAELPALTGRVVDNAGMIDPATKAALESTLEAFEKKTSIQIVVATVPDLDGEAIEPYANRLFRAWALGQAGDDNGALLLVSRDDRKMRIEVGYGLEGTLTDLHSKLIIENTLVPAFRAGDFSGGISRAVDQIIQVLEGNAAELTSSSPGEESEPISFEMIIAGIWLAIILGGFLVSAIVPVFGKKIGPHRYRWLGMTFDLGGSSGGGSSAGGWSSGSSWSGGGGGGGFSGGGGSSGGGGASGSW